MNHKAQTIKIENCCNEFIKSFNTDADSFADNTRSRVFSFHDTQVHTSFDDMKVFFHNEYKRLELYANKYNLDVNYLFKILFS